jgi:hypothetical protein
MSKLASVRLFLACGCIQKSTIKSIKATTTGVERTGCREKIHSFISGLDGYFSKFLRERRGLMAYPRSTDLDGLDSSLLAPFSFLSNALSCRHTEQKSIGSFATHGNGSPEISGMATWL